MNNTVSTCICGKHDAEIEMPTSLRSNRGELEYQCAKILGTLLPLDKEPHLLDYKYWYIIRNRFPYDMAYREHDMLIPRSGVTTRSDLGMNELGELNQILEELGNQYDLVFENFSHRRSILSLYHLHLARYHTSRKDFKG